MKRVFYLVIDQLAGHWEESVKIEGTDLPPANVKGYHEMGLIPNFSYLIENGLWVKRPWNRGICITSAAMMYLATGRYAPPLYKSSEKYWTEKWGRRLTPYIKSFLTPTLREGEYIREGLFEYAGLRGFKCASFTCWLRRGEFYTPSGEMYWPYTDSIFNTPSDIYLWRNFVKPYLINNPDFNLIHVYFPMNDLVTFCPSYQSVNPHPLSSKHSYMLFLDKLIGEIVDFLQAENMWDDTYFIIASDHGYHLGCTVAHEMGVETNNWCCDHQPPWDCEVWDFKNNRSTGIASCGPRRITFILSGGGLEEKYRGKFIDEAEIIDVIPTIAQILDIPYKCEGKSILKLKNNNL